MKGHFGWFKLPLMAFDSIFVIDWSRLTTQHDAIFYFISSRATLNETLMAKNIGVLT